jgi:hypothetical protein
LEAKTTTLPARSLQQRERALKTANVIRMSRAREKQQIRTLDREGAEARVAAILRDTPAPLATMKLLDLLLAVPKVGRVKANRILVRLRISPSKSLHGLTDRQRDELIRELGA